MTNLEFYKDKIKKEYLRQGFLGDALFIIAKRHGYDTEGFVEEGKIIDWLLEEHKEPIKLKKWERDLLAVGYCANRRFCDFDDLLALCDRGYFTGITDIKGGGDTSMTLKEILENCDVIEEDVDYTFDKLNREDEQYVCRLGFRWLSKQL